MHSNSLILLEIPHGPMGPDGGRHTVLDISLEGYLALVDWTGRQLREDKRGALSGDMEEILVKQQQSILDRLILV